MQPEQKERYLHTTNSALSSLNCDKLFMLQQFMTFRTGHREIRDIKRYLSTRLHHKDMTSDYKPGSEKWNNAKEANEKYADLEKRFDNKIEAITEYHYNFASYSKQAGKITVYKIYDVIELDYEGYEYPQSYYFIGFRHANSFSVEYFFNIYEFLKDHNIQDDIITKQINRFKGEYIKGYNDFIKVKNPKGNDTWAREKPYHAWLDDFIIHWVSEGKQITWYADGDLKFFDITGALIRTLTNQIIEWTGICLKAGVKVWDQDGDQRNFHNYFAIDPKEYFKYCIPDDQADIKKVQLGEPENFFEAWWNQKEIDKLVITNKF